MTSQVGGDTGKEYTHTEFMLHFPSTCANVSVGVSVGKDT